jgi:hypothetical protein
MEVDMRNNLGWSLLFIGFFALLGCSGTKKMVDTAIPTYKFTSEPAVEWTSLFERESGWFGADGIFTIPLDGSEEQGDPNKKTLFIFSDTYIGEVDNGAPLEGNVMVNNTLSWLDGVEPKENNIEFTWNKDAEGKPTSYFVPSNELAEEGEYFWLGDGFVNAKKDDALYIFAYHVHKTGPNVFDFEQTNISLLKIDKPYKENLANYQQIPTSLGFIHPEYGRVYFGSGLFNNTKEAGAPSPDGYLYIYGLIGKDKSLIAARVKAGKLETFDAWRYWDGFKWNRDKMSVAPITNGISNELSVSPTEDGHYLLTFQILGISDKVGIQVGNSPIGPFGPINEVYTCPEYAEGLLPYNAKAHYHLSSPGTLLISYNTITFNFWEDIQKDATIYHPRFIEVKYEVED